MNIIREKYYKYVIDTIYQNSTYQQVMNQAIMDLVCFGISYVDEAEIIKDIKILGYREWLEDLKDRRKNEKN